MDAVTVFHERAQEYDHWFDENERVYQAELAALQQFIPRVGIRVEIDVGTGRTAVPLGVAVGIEPAWHMAQIAHRRGIAVCQAVGEQLPFRESQFDFALARPRHLLRIRCAAAALRRALRAQTRRADRHGLDRPKQCIRTVLRGAPSDEHVLSASAFLFRDPGGRRGHKWPVSLGSSSARLFLISCTKR